MGEDLTREQIEKCCCSALDAQKAQTSMVIGAEFCIALCHMALRARAAEPLAGLYEAIAHGDEKHRAWLKAALEAWQAGKPIPVAAEAPPAQDKLLEALKPFVKLSGAVESCAMRGENLQIWANHHNFIGEVTVEEWRRLLRLAAPGGRG